MSLDVSIRKHMGAFDLSVDLSAGSGVVGLLGASGCGKTLTMRCIAGIEEPDEGRIVVNGRVFFDSTAGVNLSPQERKTALLFQNYMLFPNFTVEENVAAGIPRATPAEERRRIVERELSRFDVISFAKRYPHQLSGGGYAYPKHLIATHPECRMDVHALLLGIPHARCGGQPEGIDPTEHNEDKPQTADHRDMAIEEAPGQGTNGKAFKTLHRQWKNK